jgi:hypothetical protein
MQNKLSPSLATFRAFWTTLLKLNCTGLRKEFLNMPTEVQYLPTYRGTDQNHYILTIVLRCSIVVVQEATLRAAALLTLAESWAHLTAPALA